MTDAFNATLGLDTLFPPAAEAENSLHKANVSLMSGALVSTTVKGTSVRFFVTDRDDSIQGFHARGVFYEQEELEIITKHFPIAGVFVDVGANVGNHTLFVGKYLRPQQIIVLEPNQPAIEILRVNIELNGLQYLVDASCLGVGLSDIASVATADTPRGNLGGTRLVTCSGAQGTIRLMRGDTILRDRRIDFLKIDVEGMELRVLAGLEETIARWRPPMFIEVDNSNVASFHEWMRLHDYATACRYRRYDVNENYMALPVEKPGPVQRA